MCHTHYVYIHPWIFIPAEIQVMWHLQCCEKRYTRSHLNEYFMKDQCADKETSSAEEAGVV